LIVQFLAAAVAGVLLFYRTLMHKIKSILGIKEKNEDDFMDEANSKEDQE